MKREIKFRFFYKSLNKMVYRPLQPYDCEHKDIVVMQFTGIKDKNGVEIYQGDYLVDRYPIYEEDESKGMNESLMPVVWCNTKLQWCVDASFKKDGSYLVSLVEYFGEHLEVKGNIYNTK